MQRAQPACCAPTSSRSRASSTRAKPLFDPGPRALSPASSTLRRELRGLPGVSSSRRRRERDRAGETSKPIGDFPPPPADGARRRQRDRAAGRADRSRTTNLVGGVIKLRRLRRRLSLSSRGRSIRASSRTCALTAGERRRISRSCRRTASACRSPSRILFTGVALVVLLSAIWLGLGFANRLVAPIRRLIGAAKEVSTGNLDVQVPVAARRTATSARSARPSTP